MMECILMKVKCVCVCGGGVKVADVKIVLVNKVPV